MTGGAWQDGGGRVGSVRHLPVPILCETTARPVFGALSGAEGDTGVGCLMYFGRVFPGCWVSEV